MKHKIVLTQEQMNQKMEKVDGVMNITLGEHDFNVGDIVNYVCFKDDGSKETHVFEINTVKEVKITSHSYLGCADWHEI